VVLRRFYSHLDTLFFLGLRDYLRYLFLKRLKPYEAMFLYVRKRIMFSCLEPVLERISFNVSRVDKNFVVKISLDGHLLYNIVSSSRDLNVLTGFFAGALEEIFCLKLYDIKDPSSYDLLIDIGSTFGEYSLYMMIKGFRGEIITVEPLAFTVIPWRKHIHLQIAISSPEDFEKIFGKSSGKRSIIKIDCEGCEKHLKPQHLQMLKKGSILIIEAHNPYLYQNIKQMITSVSGEIISEIKTENNVWIILSVL